MNQEILHTFAKGQKSDIDDHIKAKDSYILGEHGRLHSEDGTLSFTSIEGTKEIYANEKIVKYLGACSFKDQIIIFAKCSGLDVNVGGVIFETQDIDVVVANNFEIDLLGGNFGFLNEISENSSLITYTENTTTEVEASEVEIEDNYAPQDGSEGEVNFDDYYSLNVNVPSFSTCEVSNTSIPPNNENFADCIMSLQEDENGNLYEKVLWSGYQNWPIDGKIVALGIDENSNYKRVKYTDYVNPFRSINVLDSSLFKRSAEELQNFQSTILLQPQILSQNEDGQLKSMAAQYYYRLITENGQVTEFSPGSEMTYVFPKGGTSFRGGFEGEVTNKSVKVRCNILDPINFNEIECIVLEYESNTIPTSIRSLGIKEVSSVVEFNHFGSETEFADSVTLADIVDIKTQWKYCSDLEEYNNKLIVSALRNDPVTATFEELKTSFALHGWDSNGNTHDTFINPDPVTYSQIPPNYTGKLFYTKKRVYRSIKIFQNAIVSFTNVLTNDKYSTLIGSPTEEYRDYTEAISNWILDLQENDANFNTYFPNLTIEYVDNAILLKPTVEATQTDMVNYLFKYDNTQIVEDIDNESVFLTSAIGAQTYIDGAMSAGFNSGTGLRITYRLVEEELATKATGRFTGAGPIIDYNEPSLKRTFVKDEIYRTSIQLYKDGERLFAIPIGDIHIPSIGDTYKWINDQGVIVISSDKYVNQKVVGNKLYGVRVELNVEFRMDCRYSSNIDMFQLLYVDRDESNRTVLCQGISAPLGRLQKPVEYLGGRAVDERLDSKWILPYHGGPVYDKEGLDEFDSFGGEYQQSTYDQNKRILHHRALMYFDSPDIIYGNISDTLVSSSEINVLGKLNTDHTPGAVMISGESEVTGNPVESYPKFSRKIPSTQLNTIPEVADWPKLAGDQNADNETWVTQFVNVSVFSKFTLSPSNHTLNGAVGLLQGQTVPGTDLGTTFELSNNAFCLPCMPWWYSNGVRAMQKANDQYSFEALAVSNISYGEKTIFMKTATNIFTNDFIGPNVLGTMRSQMRRGENSFSVRDTHALINIKRNNAESIYGGRSEQAYSKNVFIALSETIPINKNNNGAQTFKVQGDAYISLFIRTKNSHGDNEVGDISNQREINNGRTSTAANRGDLETSVRLNGAWCYAAVLETMIEPKLNDEYEFYRETSGIDFSIIKQEVLNSAYLQRNTARKYIPKPFRFKDDPNLDNIIAASEVKLAGEYYDSWSSFLANEFQALEKSKGAALNIVKEKDQLFAIQERQTTQVYIDRDEIVTTEAGTALNVAQGSGGTFGGVKRVSKYGTNIRRSVVKTSDFGFMFIDPIKKIVIKTAQEISLTHQMHHDFYKKYSNDLIINCEPFYDEKYKESGITITTVSGDKNTIVYNEVLQEFNGWYPLYKSSLYIDFKKELFAPIESFSVVEENIVPNSEFLHKLNQGDYLNIFDQEGKLKIQFVTSMSVNENAIYSAIAMILNDGTPFEKIEIKTKEGFARTILPTHKRYAVKEGIHSVPLLNYWFEGIDNDEKKRLRSEWAIVTITLGYNEGLQKKINSAIIYARKSYH